MKKRSVTTAGKIEFGRDLVVLVTMPFWLNYASRPCHAQNPLLKTKAFETLAECINGKFRTENGSHSENDEFAGVAFKAVNLLEMGGEVPDGMARRKGALIVSNNIVDVLQDLTTTTAATLSKYGIEPKEESCRVIYYDYGAGFVEYRLDIRISSLKDIENFEKGYEHLIHKAILPYQEDGTNRLNRLLGRIDGAIANIESVDIGSFPNWFLAEQNQPSFLTWAFSGSILSFGGDKDDTILIDEARARSIRNHIIEGYDTPGHGFYRQHFPDLFDLYSVHGDTGSFVIASALGSPDDRATDRQRVVNLIHFAWMYSCLLIESGEAAYTKEVIYFGDEISAKRLMDNTQLIRRARDLLQLVSFESRPLALCSMPIDYHLYQGMFTAAEIQTSIDAVERAISKFDSLVDEIKVYEAIRIRIMLRTAAVVGGILGIVATLVGILSYVDVERATPEAINDKINMLYNVRAAVVYFLLFVATLFMIGFMLYTERIIVYGRFWGEKWGLRARITRLLRGKRG